MNTYLVWSEGDPEPAEVEASSPHDACEKLAIDEWHKSAGECGTELSLYCEGTLYAITIEFAPEAWAHPTQKPDPVEECPEHDCLRGDDGGVWKCPACWDYMKETRRARQLLPKFEEFERAATAWAQEVSQ